MAAKAKNKEKAKGGGPGIVLSAIIALVVGCVGGGAFGYLAVPTPPPPTEKQEEKIAAKSTEGPQAPGRFPSDAVELQLTPIILEMGKAEKQSKVRIEFSIIAAHGTPNTSTLQSELREDVIAYMKGLDVKDLEGARGFQNLREQLDDRAKIRGRGAVLGLLIGGLVVE